MKSSVIKKSVTKAVEIPRDVMLGEPILSMTGFSEITLDNHKGIIEYTDTSIRVRTKNGQIMIRGKNLFVDYYTNDEIRLNGRIDNIELRQ